MAYKAMNCLSVERTTWKHSPSLFLSSRSTMTTNSVVCETEWEAAIWWWGGLIKRPAQASNTSKSMTDDGGAVRLWKWYYIAFFDHCITLHFPHHLLTHVGLSCLALNLVVEENGLINKDSLVSLLSLMYSSWKDLGILLMIVLA